MQDIDFLPQRYREAHADRSSHIWRVVIVAVVAAVISSTAGLQIRRRAQLREHVGLARANLLAVRGQSAELPELERRMQHDEIESQLHTYLRHPWPKTQVLAALVRPLPEAISLTSIRIGRENAAASSVLSAEHIAAPGAPPSAPTPETPSAKEDLELLRKQFDGPRTVIHFAGNSQDAVALHHYLAELGRCDLLVDPELLSVQSSTESSAEGTPATKDQASVSTRSFSARVYLRASFGQPNGPTADELRPASSPAEASVAALQRSREDQEASP